MSKDRESQLQPSAPGLLHRMFGCRWQEDKRGFERRCRLCGRFQVQVKDGNWPSHWEERERWGWKR